VPAKRKHRGAEAATPALLRARVERAAREGRFQQALELAKQLHKQEPSPPHLELLRRAYLGRARQLRGQGHTRDAVTVLRAALAVDRSNAEWLGQIAAELAQSGEVKEALALLTPDAPAAAAVLAHAADAAVPQGDAGRALLPAAWQADFARVVAAFRFAEAGNDEAARAELQLIGLRSPFLEWKLLLRGLQAYYQHDDARALENWQRLAPDRVPARLAAPYRFHLDAAFRAAQPPETQAILQRQFDRVQGSTLLQRLRLLRAALAETDDLAPAFRHAEALLPDLRREAPHLETRLAACFYWAVMDSRPDDVRRYQRVFGRPADDPNFHRLNGLAHDRHGNPEAAHREWQGYEKDVAADPARWPAGQAERARALIWLHMGRNAAAIPDDEQAAKLPRFLRDDPDRPRPLKPSAEPCYQRALELAPDLLEAHEALFRLHRAAGRAAKAEKAGRALLERFPDHVPTLEGLGDVLLDREKYAEALELARRAFQAHPLDRTLRGKVVTTHMYLARSHAEADRFDDGRREYQAALALAEERDAPGVLCRWAACEFRAKDDARAEELLRQARARAPSPLGVAYLMLVESVRLKLPRPLKARFEAEFKAGLEAPPTAAAAAFLAQTVYALHRHGAVYHGQKTHAKKVLAYVERARGADFGEQQLEDVCDVLAGMKATRAARRFTEFGTEKYPSNPLFPFLTALTYFTDDPLRTPVYPTKSLLETAERLARARPPDEKRDRLLEAIQLRLKALAALNPFGFGFMPDVFDDFFGGPDEDDDY
jgi:tetratricopeptide (TPR) repeat protein